MEPEASIRIPESKVTPSPEFFQQHKEYSAKNYNYRLPLSKTNLPTSKLIIKTPQNRNNHYHYYPQSSLSFSNNNNNNNNNAHYIPLENYHNNHNNYHQSAQLTLSSAYNMPNVQNYHEEDYQKDYLRRESQNTPHYSKILPDPTRPLMIYQQQQQQRITTIPSTSMIYPMAYQQPQMKFVFLRRNQQPPTITHYMRPAKRTNLIKQYPTTTLTMQALMNKYKFQNIGNKQNKFEYNKFQKFIKPEIIKTTTTKFELQPQNKQTTTQQGFLMLKPAKNTGFDPGSIVIEKGFKPIIVNQHIIQSRSDNNYNSIESNQEQQDESINNEPIINRNNNFEPMFIPSPPDSNNKKQFKKKTIINKIKDIDNNNHEILKPSEYIYSFQLSSNTESSDNEKKHRIDKRSTINDNENNLEEVNFNQDNDHIKHKISSKNTLIDDLINNNNNNGDGIESNNTGKIILANIKYILLTVIMYYIL